MELINKHKFTQVALEKHFDIFVVNIATLEKFMEIHIDLAVLIGAL